MVGCCSYIAADSEDLLPQFPLGLCEGIAGGHAGGIDGTHWCSLSLLLVQISKSKNYAEEMKEGIEKTI